MAKPLLAQIDDVADSPWALPVWDAIERYRQDPLCLNCMEPNDLTVLPGIGINTASRIMKLVNKGIRSLETIADTLCLSTDQFIILNTCTTFDCTCPPTIQSARMRSRLRMQNGNYADMLTRLDVDASVARIGGFSRRQNDTLFYGAWLQVQTKNVSLVLGNFKVKSSTGLVYGGSRFSRTVVNTESSTADIKLQPWTSTWLDGSLRGIGILYCDSVSGMPMQLSAMYSNKLINGRNEILTGTIASYQSPLLNFGIGYQRLQYNKTSVSTGMATFSGLTQSLFSVYADKSFSNLTLSWETALDQDGRFGTNIIASSLLTHAKLIGVVRWFERDLRSPYGNTVSTQSYIGNEMGITVGAQFRIQPEWRCEASLDVHRTLTRSFGKPQPAKGYDLLFNLTRGISKGAALSLRLRYEQDDDGWKLPESNITKMYVRRRGTVQADYAFSVARSLRVRLRVDGRAAQFGLGRASETGLLAFTEFVWQPFANISFRTRLTTYRSPSIEVAPYAVEVETEGMMRTIVGSGNGDHSLLAVSYSLLPFVTISAAYIETVINGLRNSAGSIQIDTKLPSN
ncbi:MAG: hypothetical protein HYX66_03900 [Ignavibacteria bacterium]|nr:hypothetical protein [Ignavibacteria bacterium]